MLITPANLNIFFTALETRFWTAVGTTPVFYDRITTTFPVGTETWLAGWLDMIDKVREWVGPRTTHAPAPLTYQVPIQNFELTEGVDLFKLEDDQYGIYTPTVSYMGMQTAKWADYQLRDMLQNQNSQIGGRQNCYDTLTYFNTAHQNDFYDTSKGTYANDLTGGGVSVNGTTVGGALAINPFATAWEDMTRRKSASGEPWGVLPDLAMVPSMLKLTLDTILQAQFIGAPVIGGLGTGTISASGSAANANQLLVGATDNVLRAYCDRLVWPDLGGSTSIGGGTYDNVWYLMDTKRVVRPFAWLLRQAPDFVYRVQPDDPVVFDTHTVLFGSKMRGAPAWSFPAFAVRSGP